MTLVSKNLLTTSAACFFRIGLYRQRRNTDESKLALNSADEPIASGIDDGSRKLNM
jgi:hypothetical protein